MRGEITMKYSDETINAYADNHLLGQEKVDFENALQNDPALQLALNNIYTLKQQVHGAYKNIESAEALKPAKTYNMQIATYAAILLLTFSGGWISSNLFNTDHTKIGQVNLSTKNAHIINHKYGKYIIHIGKRDDNKFKRTLNQVEALLAQNKNNSKNLELEIIANADGLDLLRVGATPYSNRVKRLITNYSNIKFIACANALERLQKQGIAPNLIKSVRHSNITAIDQVIRRVNDGWTYIKI
ncbi:hypothetical protein MNBD_GAMMA07-2636 [hydrothermal vent metagenome]|uniref:Intracellular sulfur oxidation DsrE/DsrF family protein n=1 Tax=hydrothermal vent metagenome TaxID=652676 RepID=A0A3B0XMD7_9ZZZZ